MVEYQAFLKNFKEQYPEIYMKIVMYPDEIVVGWINELAHRKEYMNMEKKEEVAEYFKTKIALMKIILP